MLFKRRNRKRKAIIDDGMNPELVEGAEFDGIFDIPIIHKPDRIIIPPGFVPFSKRDSVSDFSYAVHFCEMDSTFSSILRDPWPYIKDLARFSAILSPDCSVYRDATHISQLNNIYRNRALGFFFQKHGIYVIPHVRWGDEFTYTEKFLPEKVAFRGVEKNSIVAVSTYGCIRGAKNEYHFEAGFEAMFIELEPAVVLVHGSNKLSLFERYSPYAQFFYYPDWISSKRKSL